jgi:hypothetical protein
MICPICKETLIPAEANFLECPTKINNYYYDGLSAPQISHYRRDVDWNLAWIKLYPYKIVQDYEYKENNQNNKKTINKKEQQIIRPSNITEGIYKNLSYLETLDDEQLAIELSKLNL